VGEWVEVEAVCLVSSMCPCVMLGYSAGPDGMKDTKEDGEQSKEGGDK
jgi:hypothetical protein